MEQVCLLSKNRGAASVTVTVTVRVATVFQRANLNACQAVAGRACGSPS